MAIIATLIGGIIGFASFVISMLFFDASFLAACGIYLAAGMTASLGLITLTLIPTRADGHQPKAA
jgi:hypothetical protein